jgi:hypothetical protein
VKFYNNTKIPDEILQPLLAKAGRAVHTKTTETIVQVNSARSGSVSGKAYAYWWAKGFRGLPKGKKIKTDGGMFSITLPRFGCTPEDSLRIATRFFNVACHEWVHIRDFQEEKKRPYARVLPWAERGESGRRANWKNRPEEQRAEFACADAKLRGKDENWAYEEIMALAIALDEARK